MGKRYLTRAEILASDAKPGERACDMPNDPKLETFVRDLVARYVSEAKTPTRSDLAWAVRALLNPGGFPYADDARDRAAEMIANRYDKLRGDGYARREVRHRLLRLARRDGRSRRELQEQLVLSATPDAAKRAGMLPARFLRGVNPDHLANVLDDEVLRVLKRDLRGFDREREQVCDATGAVIAALAGQRASNREIEAEIASMLPTLDAMLSVLSPLEGKTFAAWIDSDCSITAAAERLSKPVGTVSAQITSARKKIRKKFSIA